MIEHIDKNSMYSHKRHCDSNSKCTFYVCFIVCAKITTSVRFVAYIFVFGFWLNPSHLTFYQFNYLILYTNFGYIVKLMGILLFVFFFFIFFVFVFWHNCCNLNGNNFITINLHQTNITRTHNMKIK